MHLSCLGVCGRMFVHVELGPLALTRAYRQQATVQLLDASLLQGVFQLCNLICEFWRSHSGPVLPPLMWQGSQSYCHLRLWFRRQPF